MDEQFDKDLINRIREVFDDYEDPTADEGWLELRKKFPEKKSRRPVAWIWRGAAAALVLLCMGIGFLIYDGRVKPTTVAHTRTKASPVENLVKNKPGSNGTANTGSNKETKLPNATIAQGSSLAQSPAITKGHNENNHPVTNTKGRDLTTPANFTTQGRQYAARSSSGKTSLTNSTAYNPSVAPQKSLQNGTVDQHPALKNNPANVIASAKNPIVPGKIIDSAIINKVNTTQLLAANSQKTTGNTDTAGNKPAVNSANTTLAAVKQAKTRKVEDTDPRRIRLAISAGTYVNYAKGSSSQMNMGLGFTSDIPLTRKLSLVTGINVSQNSLNFAGTPPPAIQQNHLVAAAAPKTASIASAYFAPVSTPKFQNYNANLIALDIPVNLKYQFSPKKSDAYISAGLSSGTFIDENYVYKYNYPSLFSPAVQQTLGTSAHNRFNNFYVAKVVNVAFGVGRQIGRNRVIIEPFLKYPLDGVGSQQLRFGTGGVNLKLNLLSGKK
ncbi:MAG: hypothetical protein NVSMB24_36580 [Mucilaginibacter sp.]